MATQNATSEVCDFYCGGHILITGATGFMGKILIEKLLRDCPDIEHLYLLIRVKKGKEPHTRLKELFDDPVFQLLKTKQPKFMDKVTVVPGDCSSAGLGLSETDRQKLISTLTHVFHGAATVRFDEKLRQAISVNVSGVREMMAFCKSCSHLKSVMHTSTAYANCIRSDVNEKFYPAPMTGDSALDLLKCMDDSKLDTITLELIKPWPNTYSYTKAIAEEVIQSHGKGLPIGVFRPSIVIGTAHEPVKGWIDNLYGPTGVVVGVGAGLMRVLYADGQILADLVPVDMAVNALICAAVDVSKRHTAKQTALTNQEERETKTEETKETESDIPIYHFTISRENPLTWKDYLEMNMRHGKKIPSIKAIWYYTLTITKVWGIYRLLTILYHLLPALIMDSGLLLSGNKAQMWRAYQKIHKFSGVISHFSTREWVFGHANTSQLWDNLPAIDKSRFLFDMKTLNWDQYFKESVDGVRIFLFQDQPHTLPAARRKMFLFHIAHRVLQLALFILAGWMLYSMFSTVLSYKPDLFTKLTAPRWESRKYLMADL